MLQTLERNVHTFDAQVLTPRGPRRWQNLPARQGCHFCRRTVSAPRWKTARSSRIMLASRSCRRPPP